MKPVKCCVKFVAFIANEIVCAIYVVSKDAHGLKIRESGKFC